ncbi:uncharacterized protein LOC133996101 isoform X2 [Scomber scombrus]|uniref:uncharacterized protein LOC133996101 isoform X2 n=1 Tax=Scomber scombrus TaxID=13677 RepID=UPI002DDC2909|nr:uncharacterized protein LOC133996101 isoform X2 [Scomber scombrus]
MESYPSSLKPKNEMFQSSEASSSEESCFDDDEECDIGPSLDDDSVTNINCQLDSRDNSPFTESDSFKEMTASCTQQEEEGEAAFSSDELSWDEDDGTSDATQKPEVSAYNSKNYCYVCGKGVIKSARHLLTHANEEPEIAEAFSLPKNSKERKQLLDDLRNRGNYKHNQGVLRDNSGELKLRRRPTATGVTAKTCTHCLYCKGMFQRKKLWRHVAKCPSKTQNSVKGGKTRVLSEIALAESPFSEKLTSDVWEMLLTMKPDEIALAVQNDYLLMQLAQYLSEKSGNKPNKHDIIRQKLREMGRLLLALREKSIFSFEEAIKPENFYRVAEAVKDIAGFDEKMKCYKTPNLASKIGHSLKAIGNIALAEADGNEQMMKDTKKFMKLYAKHWTSLFYKTVQAWQNGQRINNPSTIPFTHDVQMFHKYLETASASAIEGLKMYEKTQIYSALCRVTLAQASVLNKCAPEVSKMTLKAFQEREETTKVLSKNFIRINTLGRSGQNVAVLLTSELVGAITLLVNKRDACGVHKHNPFLFARPNSSATSLYHGRNCIRAFSCLCGLKNPEHFRSMHLYKHIARVFQILNLENDELNHLAKLLGHDIRADRDYYRLPEAAVELAKIAKLLLAMEKGSLEIFKGNSLEDIEIEDELESDVEQGNPNNADAEEDNEVSDCMPQQSDAVEQQGSQLSPEQDALEHIKACRDKPSLEERFIDPSKGRGVFALKYIEPSTFVVEYRGNIFPHQETEKKKCDTLNCYFFDFSWNGTNWRIDASIEDRTLGRLVNDDHISPNCEMKKIVCEGKPHLCLFAVKKISPGEEITYKYGDSSYPWRSRVRDSAVCSSAESCCDEEYLPDSGPTSDNQMNNSGFTESGCSKQQSSDASCMQQEDKGNDSPDGSDSDSDSSHIDASSQSEDPHCTSRNYCYVCGESKSKISRHLFTHRNEEADIAKVFALRRKSKERKRLLNELRNRGNYKHNQTVLKSNQGQLKLIRKSSISNTDKKELAVCLYCKGMHVRKHMWRHLQKCPAKKYTQSPIVVKTKISTMVAVAESTDSQGLSSDLIHILKKLKNDEVASIVRNDSHILQLAQYINLYNEGKTKKVSYIQQKLREMGRLLLQLRTKSIFSFEEAIKPQNFSKLAEAVKEVAGFSEEMKSCNRPSVYRKLGISLKNLANINLARALKENADKQTIEEAETFVKLCAEEWIYVHSSQPNVDGLSTIPFIQDIQLFYQCMDKTASSAVESLTMYESPPVYIALLRVTVAQVSVYNKSALDVSTVSLKSFKEWEETELLDNTAVCQSQFEQILSKRSMKINVMSNGDKKLAVTLTPEVLSAIKLLVSKRESCDVHESNPFLFGRPAAKCISYLKGRQCVQTFVDRCKAKNPEHLRSLFFHKHILRVFQILSLTNNELDQLSKLLGCDIRTDRDYYQSPEAAVDIAKISELLSAMENGSLETFKGKSLEEIEFADKWEPEAEQDNPKISDAEEDNEESEISLQLSGRSSSNRSFSAFKKTSRVCQVPSSRKRGRPKKSESSELNNEKRDAMNTEKDDKPDEMSLSCAVNTREERPSRSKDKASYIYFSDDDEDMNVDFDMDLDTDEELPLSPSGHSSSKRSFSALKKTSSVCQVPSPRKRGRPKKTESKKASSELNNEKCDAMNTEKDDKADEISLSCAVNTREERPSCSKDKAANICFSDDDEDMNVDFNMDLDTDEELPFSPLGHSSSKRSFSALKKTSSVRQVPSPRKRGRPKKTESKKASSELNKEKRDAMNTEKDDKPDEISLSCAVNTREERPSCSKGNASNICVSDDDDGLNLDFDMDLDTDDDIDRILENDSDGDTNSPAATPVIKDVKVTKKTDNHSSDKKKGSSSKSTPDTDLEGTMDSDAEKENRKKGEGESNWMDVDCRYSSATLNTGKKSKLLATLAGTKQLKIFIPKLDIEKFQFPVNMSQLPSLCNSVERPVRHPPIHDYDNEPSPEKDIQMSCSHCKTSMLKGQTAFQKKGFMDVFCTKRCLFQMFPINKTVVRTCHYCLKAITQLSDLIMAAVDRKGTMKDFCSPACLLFFKSNPEFTQTLQSICSQCDKTCTSTCELTLDGSVYKFCNVACLDDFRRDNMTVCENCNSYCHRKPLVLKMEEGTKTICSDNCLDEFKEQNINTPHKCTMCQTSQPVSDMIAHKSGEDTVELFCSRTCVTSYKLRPVIVYKLQGKINKQARMKRWRKGTQSNEKTNTEDEQVGSDSTANQNDASPAANSASTPTLIIADSCVLCCHCGKSLPRGQTLYQPRNSLEVFCSASCLSVRHPHINLATKSCYNCCQVIMRPHNIILAPVDDSGTMKELCSSTCLAFVQSKRKMAAPKPPPKEGPRSECRMCARFCYCKYKLTVDGTLSRVCGDACFIKYHKDNNLPLFTCDICNALDINVDKQLLLMTEDGDKTICSEECLVKFKEEVKSSQLCTMCQTSHRLSDMVENKNDEGKLNFFCSNRCMMVYKAQSFTESETKSPSSEENDIKEVKPLVPNLEFIKEEPIDEEYNQNLPSSVSTADIKDEPNMKKEDLKICSVFSLTDDCMSAAPTLTRMDLPASCSSCKKVLMDGETVYQRKSHADIFCSTSCLLQFYQMKPVKKTCHFCLQVITQPQDILEAPVDNEGQIKDFCSQTCFSSFNYKRIVSTKIPIVPVASQSQCSICSRYCISKHEVVQEDTVYKICSEPCFLRFCNLSICKNCNARCNTPLKLKMDDDSKTFCGAECLEHFKHEITTPQPCSMCNTSCLMSDMVENKSSEDVVELFCSSSCLMASKIQAVSASGTELNCDNCSKTTVPACHLAMSDASIKNFCALTCAMVFKETHMNGATSPAGAHDQTQCDSLKTPEKLPCAQCRCIIKTAPQVVQKKGKMNFVCSSACAQEFKRVNNIIGECEYCKMENIIGDAKRVNNKDCYFCSDSCRVLFEHNLEKKWGKYCRSCAYCLSISETVVTAYYENKTMKFCSEDCNLNYKMLHCRVASCDTCSRKRKLKQSLSLLGEVKHFCDMKCLLLFCNKKGQMVNTAAAESSPVIANVISLAGVLKLHHSASTDTSQHDLVSDIQTKVVGHAGVQTVPKELKNKSMLCTPLVHNKGVSCATQTVDAEAQTDVFVPKVITLPVPVPVYVPVPMNMYSQYTPKPVGLPLPLPVPVLVPVMLDNSDSTIKSMKDNIPPDSFEGEFSSKVESQDTHVPKDLTSHCSDDLDRLNNQDSSFSDTRLGLLSRPHTHKEPLLNLDMDLPREPHPAPPPLPPDLTVEMKENPLSSLSPVPTRQLLQETVVKIHNKNKGRKLQQSPQEDKERTSHRNFSEAVTSRYRKLNSQYGIDAWRRWIQWRESQTNPDLVSRDAALKEDILRCSVAELSQGLCHFITELKRPDGEQYSPDSLFYLCLSIQQYLYKNGRMENIFSDLIYSKFLTVFTKILQNFKPSVAASGNILFCVEEEFLWDCKQLGAYSPIVLLNTLLFFCCKYFDFTTVEQHRQLSFAHVVHYTKTNQDNTETTFLRFYLPSTNEADSDGVPAKKQRKNESEEEILEMKENTENPLRCPVRLYEFYVSKCPKSVRRRSDLFYLQPDHFCLPNSLVWFSTTPLDDDTMEAMLIRTLTIRELWRENRSGTDQQTTDDPPFIPDEEDSE